LHAFSYILGNAGGHEDEEVELRIPGSFDFEGHGNGVVGAAAVGTIDPFNAVRTFGNSWWHMQVR
jgi:hypothetical protein